MSQMHIDPEQVETFARALGSFSEETREQLQKLGAQLREMGGSSWRDGRYDEYERDFSEVEAAVLRLCETLTNEHVHHLQRLADRAREYTEG